jgi:hypothetical protein
MNLHVSDLYDMVVDISRVISHVIYRNDFLYHGPTCLICALMSRYKQDPIEYPEHLHPTSSDYLCSLSKSKKFAIVASSNYSAATESLALLLKTRFFFHNVQLPHWDIHVVNGHDILDTLEDDLCVMVCNSSKENAINLYDLVQHLHKKTSLLLLTNMEVIGSLHHIYKFDLQAHHLERSLQYTDIDSPNIVCIQTPFHCTHEHGFLGELHDILVEYHLRINAVKMTEVLQNRYGQTGTVILQTSQNVKVNEYFIALP